MSDIKPGEKPEREHSFDDLDIALRAVLIRKKALKLPELLSGFKLGSLETPG